ncbi:hypothetical protein EUGRSUZ_F03305 [Eucalyptus grandis]|uniref:Uncharacterized protein n=2 Tax=Eucalyptus grandis TaxID=71139 RepID=A0ACC3KLT5_EUCGR|nr:hypothetical protein EUGRSUZ_F03305 [Eucalyptus grandis]
MLLDINRISRRDKTFDLKVGTLPISGTQFQLGLLHSKRPSTLSGSWFTHLFTGRMPSPKLILRIQET